jgi:hypothetical protein
MLINLSNHPQTKWTAEQSSTAQKDYGTIVDLPFPNVDPHADLSEVTAIAQQLANQCQEKFAEAPAGRSAIHIMGEFTLTYCLIRELDARQVQCVASTTERLTVSNPDGTQTHTFRFVSFRPYNIVDSTEA